MSQEIKIRVENVCKIFGPQPQKALAHVRAGMGKAELLDKTRHALGLVNINLDIPTGQNFVIMGLSGSGKSTLIRHFNRLIDPTAGRILVDGEDILTLSPAGLRELRRSKVSMVFQRFGLLPHRSVIDNVSFGLIVGGEKPARARERAAEQIEIVGLSGFEDRFPGQLSGGMQQRVGLARALATDAEILLMDEAFSALDPLIRTDMQAQLKLIQEKLKKTIVFITHDLDEALFLGNTIAILKDGELRQVGSGSDILTRPADDYVARFVRDVNRARVVTCGAICQPAAAGHHCLPGEVPQLINSATGTPCATGFIGEDEPLEAAFAGLASHNTPLVVIRDGRALGLLCHDQVFAAMRRDTAA